MLGLGLSLGLGSRSGASAALWQRTDCVCWFDSTFGVSTSGGNVTAWADRSANGRNLGAKSGYAAPTYTASNGSYGGKPSVNFASNSGLEKTGLSLTDVITVYVVGNDGFNGTTVTNAYWYDLGDNARLINDYSGNSGLAIYDSSVVASSVRGNTPRVLAAVFDAAGPDSLYIGDPTTPAASGNAGIEGVGTYKLTLGNYGGAASFGMNGPICAYAIFNASHDATTRALVMNYLKATFGL